MIRDIDGCAIRKAQSDVYLKTGPRPGVLTYVKFVDNGNGGLLQKFYAIHTRLQNSNTDAEFFASASMQEMRTRRSTPVTLIFLERRRQLYDQFFKVNELISETFAFELTVTSTVLMSVLAALTTFFIVLIMYARCQEIKLAPVTQRASKHLFLQTGCIDNEFAPELFWERVLYIIYTQHDLISAVSGMDTNCPLALASPFTPHSCLIVVGSVTIAAEMFSIPPHPAHHGTTGERSLCHCSGANPQCVVR